MSKNFTALSGSSFQDGGKYFAPATFTFSVFNQNSQVKITFANYPEFRIGGIPVIDNVRITSVPEPTTLCFSLGGLAMLAAWRGRRLS